MLMKRHYCRNRLQDNWLQGKSSFRVDVSRNQVMLGIFIVETVRLQSSKIQEQGRFWILSNFLLKKTSIFASRLRSKPCSPMAHAGKIRGMEQGVWCLDSVSKSLSRHFVFYGIKSLLPPQNFELDAEEEPVAVAAAGNVCPVPPVPPSTQQKLNGSRAKQGETCPPVRRRVTRVIVIIGVCVMSS